MRRVLRGLRAVLGMGIFLVAGIAGLPALLLVLAFPVIFFAADEELQRPDLVSAACYVRAVLLFVLVGPMWRTACFLGWRGEPDQR